MTTKPANKALVDVDSAHPQALTRRNMRDFNRAERQEHARKRGVPTPATKNSGREYRTSQSSLNQEAAQIVAQKHTTKAPGEKADVNKQLLQKASPERNRKPHGAPESQQRKQGESGAGPSLGAKQKQAEKRADRMKITGLELIAEKEVRQEKGQDEELGKSGDAAEGPTRQQPEGYKRPPRSSTKLPSGKPPLPQIQPTDVASLFPPEFPRFQSVQNVNDIGAYLANASYIVSVGGPPVSDLKYGVILVPLGEERLLFGKQPDNAETQSLGDSVVGAEEEPRSPPQAAGQPGLHALDKDSAQFRRPRFASRGHNTESIASPALQSPVQGGEDEADADMQGPEHMAKDNAVDDDGDTQMTEEGHSAQGESTTLADTPKKKEQGTTGAAPLKTKKGFILRRISSKPLGVMKTASAMAENSGRPRILRPRRALPTGVRTSTGS
ncbi:hypothetical protein VMCG_08195 [Cytospora schulzeri]|uniref:Uncharacterized protein n=1 Tax=Cytospora schulzeri TaxID=448051 RepID=A0A423VTY8_9PEZI|nr:hypothetical protein VMCG_08195 [Valsa malicola]